MWQIAGTYRQLMTFRNNAPAGRQATSARPVLCAGQGCEWSGGCLRFRIRVSEARWASYDLERLIFIERAKDDEDRALSKVCPHFMQAQKR